MALWHPAWRFSEEAIEGLVNLHLGGRERVRVGSPPSTAQQAARGSEELTDALNPRSRTFLFQAASRSGTTHGLPAPSFSCRFSSGSADAHTRRDPLSVPLVPSRRVVIAVQSALYADD